MRELQVLLNSFCGIFISIFVEALPFVLLGSLVAGVITTFLTEDIIKKVLPKNKVAGAIGAALLGLFFPLCECATVPVTRGLVKKGVPINIAITFMMAAPIINPIVMLSTYEAFGENIKILSLRVIIGFVLSIAIGFLMEALSDGQVLLSDYGNEIICDCGCEDLKRDKSLKMLIYHISQEFYTIGKFLIIGSILASLFQVLLPREILDVLSVNKALGIIIMMALAYLLSICSEADAFVARSFLGQFSLGAVMAFLILGPMLDLKNNLMLFSVYKKSFVIKMMFVVFSLTFLAACLI